MSRDSNLYTFLFVGIMIVGIASILAYTSQTLKPMQDENVKNEKMQNILSTVGINVSREEAEKSYKKYIVEELALKIDGSINENINPFSDLNLAKELKKDYEISTFHYMLPKSTPKSIISSNYVERVSGTQFGVIFH